MSCAESLRVQAFFDGEADGREAFEVERHLQECESCRRVLAGLREQHAALRRELPRWRASDALQQRIREQLTANDNGSTQAPDRPRDRTWRVPAFWWGACGGMGASLAAAGLAFMLLVAAPLSGPTADQLIDAHIRSVNSGHLTDVVSTDRHTVKPWLAAHGNVSPLVADFEVQGYRLSGGRIDAVGGQRVAVAVYRHGAHVVDVFGWPARSGAVPPAVMRNGYHLIFWRAGGVEYCVVADTAASELVVLVESLQKLASAESIP